MAPQGRSTAAAWWVLLLALLILAVVLFQNGWRPFLLAFVVAGAGFLVVAAIALVRTPRRRVPMAMGLGLILMAVVAGMWVIPIVRGPTLECVDTDPAFCEDMWRRVTVENDGGLLPGTGIEQFFPVTKVRIWEGGCGRAIERSYIFTEASIC
jgi:energy-coupling factor transporter transmembrane protein EcfT